MDKLFRTSGDNRVFAVLVIAAALTFAGESWADGSAPTGGTIAPAIAPTLIPAAKFDKMLSSHGTWLEVQGLGRVWQPSAAEAGQDFVPYLTGGRWIETTLGRQFVSRWPWGLVVFHYGRWSEETGHGWVWSPDPVWAAAWVDWRSSAADIGWSPISPGRTECGAPEHWVFVPRARIDSSGLENAVLSPTETARLVLETPGLSVGKSEGQCSAAKLAAPARTSYAPGGSGGFSLMSTGAPGVQSLQLPAATTERDRRMDVRERASFPDRSEEHRPIRDVRFDPEVRLPRPSVPHEPLPSPWRS